VARLLLRAVVAALVAAAGTTVVPRAAWAADGVVATSPADRAALADAPSAVDLTVSAAPDPAASHVTLWDSAGADLDTGDLTRVGDVLRRPVAIRGAGDFTLTFHIVFTDGHDCLGVVRFSVGTGVAPALPDAARQRADQALAAQHTHDIDPLSGAFLVLDVVVVAAVALLLFSNPRRRRQVRRRPPGSG
jgi:methionine-rich copper-binding protein CopC